MRQEIEKAFKNAVDNAPDASKVVITEAVQTKLAALSSIVAQLRSQVSRDPYHKTVNYMPDIEGPARLAKAFAKLGKGMVAVRGKQQITEEEYGVICKAALDTIPRRRSVILGSLLDLEWKGAREIGCKVNIPTVTVGRELEDLAMIKVVKREVDSDNSDEMAETAPYRWRLKDATVIALRSSGLMEALESMLMALS